MTQDNTTLILFVTTTWSGIVSFAVAKWTLNSQNHLNNIGGIIKLIEGTNSAARAYWLSSGRHQVVESKIKYKLFKLSSEIEIVFSKQKDLLKKLNTKNIEFRKEITGGQFESEGRLDEHGRASHIQETTQEMITLINDNKKKGWFS